MTASPCELHPEPKSTWKYAMHAATVPETQCRSTNMMLHDTLPTTAKNAAAPTWDQKKPTKHQPRPLIFLLRAANLHASRHQRGANDLLCFVPCIFSHVPRLGVWLFVVYRLWLACFRRWRRGRAPVRTNRPTLPERRGRSRYRRPSRSASR